MIIDILAYIGTILIVIGLYGLGNKKLWAWEFQGFGDIFWCIYAIETSNIPVLVANVVFLALVIRGVHNWMVK